MRKIKLHKKVGVAEIYVADNKKHEEPIYIKNNKKVKKKGFKLW